jgi:uncharacterized protein
VLATAGWGEYLRFQLPGPLYLYAGFLTRGWPFKVLAMFLLGLAIGRSGLLRDTARWAPVIRRVRRFGFAIGLPAAAVEAGMFIARFPAESPLKIVQAIAYALGVAPLALAYGATLLLLWEQPRWRARLIKLAPCGRMALTNYLSQTAVSVATFYGVGLGLMGRVGPLVWTLYAVAIVTAQVAFSHWWLTRFRFGPLEWVWRQATYGRMLPLRRPVHDVQAV